MAYTVLNLRSAARGLYKPYRMWLPCYMYYLSKWWGTRPIAGSNTWCALSMCILALQGDKLYWWVLMSPGQCHNTVPPRVCAHLCSLLLVPLSPSDGFSNAQEIAYACNVEPLLQDWEFVRPMILQLKTEWYHSRARYPQIHKFQNSWACEMVCTRFLFSLPPYKNWEWG